MPTINSGVNPGSGTTLIATSSTPTVTNNANPVTFNVLSQPTGIQLYSSFSTVNNAISFSMNSLVAGTNMSLSVSNGLIYLNSTLTPPTFPPTEVTPGNYTFPSFTVNAQGQITAASSGSITAGTGLSGGTITSSGTIALANTTVTPGSYTSANITINAQGQITAAANGGGGGGGSGTVTSITAGTGLSGGTITSAGTIALANTAVTAGSYTSANITINAQGQIISAASSFPVTFITAGTGLSGGTITTSGTIALANSGVTAGNYTSANITINAQGQITAAANGGGGGGGSGTVTSITAGTGLSGGTITTSGTISLTPTAVTAGSYTYANLTVNAEGQLTAASSGTAPPTVGTSGATVGLLNANKTDSGNNTFSGTNTFSGIVTYSSGTIQKTRIVTASGAVTVGSADYIIVINKTSGAPTTVNLPASPSTGRVYIIKDGKGDAATNNITISPNAGNIDGESTILINVAYGSQTICYNGTQWNVIAQVGQSSDGAIVYYVDPVDGSDSNNGTSSATPWKTAAKVNNGSSYSGGGLLPGSSVLFKGGNTLTGSLAFKAGVNISSYSASNPITIGSYGTGNAIINPNLTGNNSYALLVDGFSGCVVTGLTVSANNTQCQFGVVVQNSITSGGISTLSVIDCIVSGFNTTTSISTAGSAEIYISTASTVSIGDTAYPMTNVNILNCVCFGANGVSGSTDDNGISANGAISGSGYNTASSNLTNVTIAGCTVYNIGGKPGGAYPSDPSAGGSGNGIILAQVQNSIIQFCLVHDCGANSNTCGGNAAQWFYSSIGCTIEYGESYNQRPWPDVAVLVSPAYYVSPSGSDSNPGTLVQPFLTPGKAQTAMRGGSTKTTYFRGGTYNIASAGITLNGSDNGTSWLAYPTSGTGPTYENPIFNGAGTDLSWIFICQANNTTFDHLTFQNAMSGISISYAENVVVSNNTLQNMINNATLAGGGAPIAVVVSFGNILISHNYLYNCGYTAILSVSISGEPGLATGTYLTIDSNTIIDAGTVSTDCGGIALADYQTFVNGTVTVSNNFINSVTGNYNHHIYLDNSCSYVTVKYNVTCGAGWFPLMFHGGQNNTVINNVFDITHCSGLGYYQDNISGLGVIDGPMTGNVVENNIVFANTASPPSALWGWEHDGSESMAPPSVTNNMYYNIGGSQFSNLNDSGGNITTTSATVANPLFANPSTFDYVLASGSPAFNTPVYFPVLTTNQGPQAVQPTWPGGCDWEGFNLDGGSQNCTIQFCYSHDNAGPGFLGYVSSEGTGAWNNNTYRYNISVNDGYTNTDGTFGCIHLGSSATQPSPCSAYVYNNTVINTSPSTSTNWGPGQTYPNAPGPVRPSCISFGNSVAAPSSGYVANNIFVMSRDVDGYTQILDTNVAIGIEFKNNAWVQQDGGTLQWHYNGTYYTSLAAWKAIVPGGDTGAILNVATNFNSGTSGIASWTPSALVGPGASWGPTAYKLTSGSTDYVNAGLNMSSSPYDQTLPSTDYFGNPIPNSDSDYNIGADGNTT